MHRLRAHGTLDDVGVELDAAIVENAGEAVPVPQAIADDPGRIRAARKPRELMLAEDLERVDERARSGLTCGPAHISTCAADVILDGVDMRNARNRLGRDGRIAALGDLEELAPQVAPAEGDLDPVRRQLLVGGIAVALHDA